MKRYIVFLQIAVLIFSVVMISGCNEEKKVENTLNTSDFIGEWVWDNNISTEIDTWIFYNNNSGNRIVTGQEQTDSYLFTWKENGTNLCFTYSEAAGLENCGTYVFTNESKTFTWTTTKDGINNRTMTFNKKI